MSIPKRDTLILLPLPLHNFFQIRSEFGGIGSYQFVCTPMDRLGALSVVSERDAGNVHHGGFLGYSSRIGDYTLGIFHQIVEFQISQWLAKVEIWGSDPEVL